MALLLVTPRPYLVGMETITVINRTAVEAWLARLGLEAVEVDRCPVAECEVCGPLSVGAAA